MRTTVFRHFRDEIFPMCASRSLLHSAAAPRAKMRTCRAHRTTLRAETSCRCRNIVHVSGAVRGNSPDECSNPADQCPTEKQVQKKNAGRIRFVSGKNGRQKIKNYHKQETEHCCLLPRERVSTRNSQ